MMKIKVNFFLDLIDKLCLISTKYSQNMGVFLDLWMALKITIGSISLKQEMVKTIFFSLARFAHCAVNTSHHGSLRSPDGGIYKLGNRYLSQVLNKDHYCCKSLFLTLKGEEVRSVFFPSVQVILDK